MTPEELNKMLGIKPKTQLKEVVRIHDSVVYDVVPERDLPGGDTCFNLDEWEIEQGERLNNFQTGGWSTTLSDLFAACFRQSPELEQVCKEGRFQQFVETLLESPDYKALHQSTRGNVLASDMATVQFANQYAQLVRSDKEREEQRSNGIRSKSPQAEKDAADMACLTAVNTAVQQALQEVDQLEDFQRGIGLGGSSDNSIPTDRIIKLFHQVKNSRQLKRITELAGRYRMMAQAKQRQKTIHGQDEMVGVEPSGDIERLTATELAQLSDPDFELDAMRRLVERQSMSKKFRGTEKQAKGPIVICVDESGSMSGEPLCQAKAFALAMYWTAKHQNRWCWLVSFSDGQTIYGVLIPPNKPEPAGLVNWLAHNYGGGTTMDVPLVSVPRGWDKCPKGKTDMVIITDEEVSVPSQMRDSFLEFKKREKVKLTTIVLGAGGGSMKPVSDEVFPVNGISVEGEAVQKCMSI